MISALRKIEGRGELTHANSAVMEMCIDNPREGFSDIFDTHPPVETRVEALVKFAGGHDPGPLAMRSDERAEPASCARRRERTQAEHGRPPAGQPPVSPSRARRRRCRDLGARTGDR